MTFFNAKSVEELKKQYHQNALKYHPDAGGDVELFKKMLAEYERLKAQFERGYKANRAAGNTSTDTSESADYFNGSWFEDIINRWAFVTDIKLEIIGSWVWISGNTYQYKEELKTDGFCWSKSKHAWYNTGGKHSYHRGRYTMNQIRQMHGTKTVNVNHNVLE